ncbi:hypothetical protein [Streptomyces sp. 1331.2]|uniref:hypothetical protein n=1 Tax=Streptomyces sp. 1331.2 TaxID=1938835 RepID=UPI00117C0D1B|nr:hypothetical protein [Streptomyces sp. 1331.2]
MLTQLLPGLRDFRTPLVAGYIWLVAVWLAVHERIPARESARGLIKDVYALADSVGRPAALAAVSLGAYLVGAVMEVQAGSVIKAANSLPFINLGWVSNSAAADLRDYVSTAVKGKAQAAADGRNVDADTTRLMNEIAAERDQLVLRIRHSTLAKYEEFARTSAEADFRVSAGIALLAPVLVLGLCYDPAAIALLVLPLWLIIKGCMRLRDANDGLVQALTISETSSGAVQRYSASS